MMSARIMLAGRLSLNRTDIDVLYGLARGLHNHEIAMATGLSQRSMYRVRQRLKQALGVRTHEQIIDEARKRGLLDEY